MANLLHSEASGKASGIRNTGDFDLLIVDQDLDKDRHIWGKVFGAEVAASKQQSFAVGSLLTDLTNSVSYKIRIIIQYFAT